MAITVINPSVTKILLDLGIDPIDPFDPDNAENTYFSAVREGINAIETATNGKGDRRSEVLRKEFQGLLSRKRSKRVVSISKLLAKKSVIPTNKIRPQSLLPVEQQVGRDPVDPRAQDRIGNVLNDILEVLRKDLKLDKKETAQERKERQRQRRIRREERIESLKGGTGAAARVGLKVVDTLVAPFRGLWEKITNFLKFTLIGVLFNEALKWFSKKENREKIVNLGRFFKDWWPTLLGGFLLFFTPLGSLVSAVTSIVTLALPTIVAALKSPAFLAALAFTAGGIDAELRKKKIREDFNKTDDDSITTVDEFKEENKNIKEPSQKKSGMSFLQGILELGSTPGMQPFNKGGFVSPRVFGEADKDSNYSHPRLKTVTGGMFNKGGFVSPRVFGEADKDTVPAMLTPGEFVITKGAVKNFGLNNLMLINSMGAKGASGVGTKGADGKNGISMYEGGGLVSNLSAMNASIKENTQTKFMPIQAKGMAPLNVPIRVRSVSKTIVLPEIKQEGSSPNVREGTTVPVFDIMSDSPSRAAVIVSLNIEDMM